MRTLITASCRDQSLVITGKPVIASGGVNEDSVQFTFDEAWDGYTKTAVFYRSKEAVYHVELVDDACVIPSEVLALKGDMFFGVFGVKGEKTKTSQVVSYHIEQGAVSKGIAPSDPTPDIYAQIMADVSKAVSVANSVREDANAGKFNGKDGTPCTHSWNGSVLVVSSASGTSSADLKGGKGDKGDAGNDGYTPVKGKDYWTDEDRVAIIEDILASLPVYNGEVQML